MDGGMFGVRRDNGPMWCRCEFRFPSPAGDETEAVLIAGVDWLAGSAICLATREE